MAEKDVLGRAGEDRAARYFESLGYTVLSRNWRAPGGELDLVVATATELVVVEVKTRRSVAFGHPFEAVGELKKARLWRLAMAWIAAHRDLVQGRRLRIDAIGLIGPDPATASLEHLEGVV
ncbi:YraN family protein [Microbacterium sp. 4R-513]|uniref:YraN family protein n=1 Tax=Microbacterium sp. 4R-513 TaxID=2567934 RepID=UPI0013E1449B|nr:YraN family protein [Microbacterium sp. 4R-513]QIG40486.1 YraN family protein [Microbacterium sp. 4R-513]